MAIYRTLHISFWGDPFVLELTPEEKYFYIYLMTNSMTNQLGCYEISNKTIINETGYSDDTVKTLIDKFVKNEKILYSPKTKEILIINWHKYSWSKSPKVEICIKKEFEKVKNQEFKDLLLKLFKDYGYSIYRLWIKETETETETKEETETKTEEKTQKEKEKLLPFQPMFEVNSFEMLCVESIIHSCIELYPNSKVPSTYEEKEKWALEIEKMKRLDNRSEDEIKQALNFAIEDSFWKGNIRSTKKFREKFETLLIQSRLKRTNKDSTEEYAKQLEEWAHDRK